MGWVAVALIAWLLFLIVGVTAWVLIRWADESTSLPFDDRMWFELDAAVRRTPKETDKW